MPPDLTANFSSRQVRPAILLTALLALLALLAAGSFAASAQAGGVHFDPESPAGKEYALPLPEARNEAAGGGDRESGAEAPLYGVGIGGPGGPTPGAPEPEKRAPAGADRSREPSGAPRAEQTPRSTEVLAISDRSDYPLSSGLWILAGILLLAGALALILRRIPAKPPLA